MTEPNLEVVNPLELAVPSGFAHAVVSTGGRTVCLSTRPRRGGGGAARLVGALSDPSPRSSPRSTVRSDLGERGKHMEPSDVPNTGLLQVLGLRVVDIAEDAVAARFDVTASLLNDRGVVHPGVLSSAVESVASIAAAAWYGNRGRVVGVANSTSHFATVSSGEVDVLAEPVHRDEARQHWAVRVLADDGRLLAHGEVQLVNITDEKHLRGAPHEPAP